MQYITVERDDRTLVNAVRRGDERAFAALFTAHHRPIYRYALHMCGEAAADDVVQETFMTLLRTHRFDPARGTLLAYLFGVARHHILKSLAIGQCELPLDDGQTGEGDTVAMTGPTVLDDLSRAETVAAVRAAIRSLPLVFREVVVLCELQELDYASAAAIVECPVGTVRSRLHRARALLTSKLASMQQPAAALKLKGPRYAR